MRIFHTSEGDSSVGKLLYNSGEFPFDIDDRTLAHLRVVFMNKLRRGEPFMLQVPDPNGIGTRSVWISAGVPVSFQFLGSRAPSIDMRWIDELMTEANSPNGLTCSSEPAYVTAELQAAARLDLSSSRG
ncbi:ATP-dependent DNA ligase [Microbacterium sp. cx-55]|nr:ATP-dependent DNA ligase [Microbacterium sp. cx-55]